MHPDRLVRITSEIADNAATLPYGFWAALEFPIRYYFPVDNDEIQVTIEVSDVLPGSLTLHISADDEVYPHANVPMSANVTIVASGASWVSYLDKDYGELCDTVMYGNPSIKSAIWRGLVSGSDDIRAFCALLLGVVGDGQAVPLLRAGLWHSSDLVRWRSAEALFMLGEGDEEVAGVLTELKDTPEIRALYSNLC